MTNLQQPADNMRINLNIFEGPLDLLLHLIKKSDLPITDIPVTLVLDQYLSHLDAMRELNIDFAGEFLLMASELMHIKSRLLLAKPEEEVEEADPRAGLVARLIEYQRYKRAAAWLVKRPILGRDVFTNPDIDPKSLLDEQSLSEGALLSVDPFTLARTFQEILKKVSRQAAHEVGAERVSVTQRIYEIIDTLKVKTSLEFSELFTGESSRLDMVVTFLAILEMARIRVILLTQENRFGAIRVTKNMEISETELSAEEIADKIPQDIH